MEAFDSRLRRWLLETVQEDQAMCIPTEEDEQTEGLHDIVDVVRFIGMQRSLAEACRTFNLAWRIRKMLFSRPRPVLTGT